jgi:predicted ester cyclase
MTRAEILRLLDEHREAFRERDASRLAAGHLSDGTFESPAAGLVRGRAAIEALYRYWFEAFPDLVFRWDSQLVDEGEGRAMFFWTLSGTHNGPFYGLKGTGAKVNTNGAAEFCFADGGIRSVRHVFDFTSVLMAAGVLKARPT